MYTINDFIRMEQERLSPQSQTGHDIISSIQHTDMTIHMDYFDTKCGISVTLHPNFLPSSEHQNLHDHDFFELVYVYKGQGIQTLPSKTMILKEHTAYLLAPNVKHSLYTESPDSVIINILIPPTSFSNSLSYLLSDNDLIYHFFLERFIKHDQNNQILCFEGSSAKITSLIVEIIEEYMNERPCYQSNMTACLTLLFTELIRSYIHYMEGSDVESAAYGKIVGYMNSHLSDVTLSELSEVCHYSTTHTSRILKKYTGRNFTDLLSDMRLERAKQLIEEGKKSNEIAEFLGFYNTSYFNKVFKRKYQITPNQYRKMINCL